MIVQKKIKILKEIEVVESTVYLCDRCHKHIIKDDYYSINSYKVVFKEGSSYPEGVSSESKIAYFCKNCSIEIYTILENSGVKFTTESCNW